MSIIVDALQKLQENSENNTYESEYPYNSRELQHSKSLAEKRLKLLKVSGAILFTITIGAFLFIKNNSSTNANVEFTPVETNPILEISRSKVKTIDEVEHTQELITAKENSISVELEKKLPVDSPPASTEEENIYPPEIINNLSAPVIASEESTALDQTIISPPDPQAIAENAQPATELEPTKILLNPIPDWILQGIEQFKSGSLADAQISWSKGFAQLEDNTQLFSIMINYNSDLAREMVNDLIKKEFPVFTMTALFKSKKAYYTLILPAQNAIETSKAIVQKNFNIEPYVISKLDMQKRINSIDKLKPGKAKPIKKVDVEKVISAAENSVVEGNYQKARSLLNPHLKKNSKNWKLLFWLGSAELGQRNFKQADNLFLKAQHINPNFPQLWTQRALIAQERNDHASALEFLSKANALSPKTPEIILNIAYSQEALRDKNGAVYSYREFLNLIKNNSTYEDLRQSVELRLNDLIFE